PASRHGATTASSATAWRAAARPAGARPFLDPSGGPRMTSASTKRRLTSLGLVVAASVAAISAAARAQVSPNGAELQVNTYTTLQQLDARVAFNGQGGFLV